MPAARTAELVLVDDIKIPNVYPDKPTHAVALTREQRRTGFGPAPPILSRLPVILQYWVASTGTMHPASEGPKPARQSCQSRAAIFAGSVSH